MRDAFKARAGYGRECVTREGTAIIGADKRLLYDADGYLLPPSMWPDDVAGAVQDYQPPGETTPARVKMIDKLGALEVLGKLSGVWADASGRSGVSVTVNVGETPDQLAAREARITAYLDARSAETVPEPQPEAVDAQDAAKNGV